MSQHIPRILTHTQRCLLIANSRQTALKFPTIRPIISPRLSPLAPSPQCNRRLFTDAPTTTSQAPRQSDGRAPSFRSQYPLPTPPPTKTLEELASSPYIVRRTPSTQLPVYKNFKSGGNLVMVMIKKVDGDRRRLLEDLVRALALKPSSIRINPTTQNLEIKGDYYEQAKSWLLARGF
ncbi:hypothetical protein E4U21_005900 [Claviceps maximensis]|nr:hypothetical protein E4U21_005900 [Claviceps maximensis]